MGARGGGLLLVLLVLVIAAFAVPYTLLRDLETFAGAFLFWAGFGVVSVVLILAVLGRWRV